MTDQSHLDSKYFVDEHVFNCPFCNRRNVEYSVEHPRRFDWTDSKQCDIWLARCSSCKKTSMHLTFKELSAYGISDSRYRFKTIVDRDLDSMFFYSVPTSFFALDERIPRILRELMTEAEGCLKSNFLTGGSACARKMVYELARIESAEGNNYDERLTSLKGKRPDVEEEYFDTLLTVQQVTSDKVHEASYDGWSANHLRHILSTLKEVLGLMYVIPQVRKEKREKILTLKSEVLGKKS